MFHLLRMAGLDRLLTHRGEGETGGAEPDGRRPGMHPCNTDPDPPRTQTKIPKPRAQGACAELSVRDAITIPGGYLIIIACPMPIVIHHH